MTELKSPSLINIEMEKRIQNVLRTYPLPTIQFEGKKKWIVGGTLNLKIQGIPLPSVDFTKEELISKPKEIEKDTGIFVVFRGEDKPIVVPAKYDRKTGLISVDIPKNAKDGILVLLYPVWEFYGKDKLFDKYKIDSPMILCWHDMSMFEAMFEKKKCYCISSAKIKSARQLATWRYYAIYIGYISFNCETCQIQCPNGAIKFDANGDCYVDVECCRGQTYSIDRSSTYITSDGREIFTRGPEESCWSCLQGNDSHKCRRDLIRRVLYNNGMCCADCVPKSRVVGLTLQQLCPNGAISIQIRSPPNGSTFVVDPARCTGCMICYYNINCHNHDISLSNIVPHMETLKMQAYIDRGIRYTLIPLSIKFVPNYEIFNRYEESLEAMILNYVQNQEFYLLLDTEGRATIIPFNLGEDLSYRFPSCSVSFHKEVHIAILSRADPGQYRLIGFNNGNLQLPIRTLDGEQQPFEVIVRIRYGELIFTYSLLRVE